MRTSTGTNMAKKASKSKISAAKSKAPSSRGKAKSLGKTARGRKKAALSRASTLAASEIQANRWTFLTNHAHVLIVLHSNPDLVLREVARQVGITERAVQRIVQDLEEDGFIRRQKVGRNNHYEVRTNQPLRHSLEAHRDIGDLLKMISG